MWTGSKLSRFCAHSHVLAELNPRPTRDKAAAKGKLFDAALEEWHTTGVIPVIDDRDVTDWLATMVENGWAWPDGCELQKAWGLSHWGTFVPVEEPEPHVYRSIDGEDLMTAGRTDANWIADGLLIIVDWKSGRSLAPAARINLQVNAGGMAHSQRWKTRGYVPGVYYAREGRWDMGEPVERGTPEWDAMLAQIEESAALDDKPHPGPHCSDCWERKNCERVWEVR